MLGLSALNRLTTLAVGSQSPDNNICERNINYVTQQDSVMLGLLALKLPTMATSMSVMTGKSIT